MEQAVEKTSPVSKTGYAPDSIGVIRVTKSAAHNSLRQPRGSEWEGHSVAQPTLPTLPICSTRSSRRSVCSPAGLDQISGLRLLPKVRAPSAPPATANRTISAHPHANPIVWNPAWPSGESIRLRCGVMPA